MRWFVECLWIAALTAVFVLMRIHYEVGAWPAFLLYMLGSVQVLGSRFIKSRFDRAKA